MKVNYTIILLFIILPPVQSYSMTGNCRISGKIFDKAGNPIHEARIVASLCAEASDILYSFSDHNGRWELSGLSPGIWTFKTMAPEHISNTVKKKIKSLLPNRLNIVLQNIPEKDKLESSLESICNQFITEYNIPGMALGVIHGNEPIFAGGFGVKNHESNQPVTADTVFNLASVSKLFVTAAILQLANRGLIDLDSPVVSYLPYFELKHQIYRFITIRHLLTHRSGLPRGPAYLLFPPQRDSYALERSIRALKNQNLPVNPGGKWQYSNIGFNILGAVIAEVSGQAFEDYMREHIFIPLEMRSSTYFKWEVPVGNLASPHYFHEGKMHTSIDNDHRPYAPCAGPFSNVTDMTHWAMAHLADGMFNGGNIYSPGGFYQALSPGTETGLPDSEKHMGLGWFLGTYKGHRIAGHSGHQVGYKSHFLLLPDDELAIVIMINNEDGPLQELNAQILDLLLLFTSLSQAGHEPTHSSVNLKERIGVSKANILYNIGGQ